jgi:hypothetical protein
VAYFSEKNIFRRNDTCCATLTSEDIVFEEKIEVARLRSTRRRKQITIGLLAAIGLCALVVFGLSSLDFPAKKNVPVANKNVSIVVSEEEGLAGRDTEKKRDEFKELLRQYENELEPRLLVTDVESWNRDALFEVSALKKKAMQHFSSGDYPKALEALQLLELKTVAILEEGGQLFAENLEKAASFLAEDLYDEAKLHIEKSLMIVPQSAEALELQQKIEKLPHILPLLNEVKVARLENDLQKEYDFLQQLLRITSDRKGGDERLKVLRRLIKNQKFDAHISAGFAAIENRQTKEAGHHYQEARKIDSEREELALLSDQLKALEKSLRVQQAIEQAEQAVRRDDWQQAKNEFARAAKDAPANQKVVEGLRRAEQILGLQARFRQYFRNPYRLAQEDTRSEAEKTLIQAEVFSNYSYGIKRESEQLGELIVKLNQLIPVTVISDNETYVSVRSVGRVGTVSEKKIQLKPGNYTFEGARDGFKSKLVKVLIPYDQGDFTVRVMCDEPI